MGYESTTGKLLGESTCHFGRLGRLQPTREREANAVPDTVAAYASWGICSITQKKKSVTGCSIPNRFSLEAT